MNKYYLEITLPGLPKTTNSKRRFAHWAQQNLEANQWKRSIKAYLVSKKPPAPLKQAKLTLTRYSSVEPDYDGLVSSFKHLIDGLTEAGVIENDRRENIGVPDYRWEKAAQGKGFIKVVVEEIIPVKENENGL